MTQAADVALPRIPIHGVARLFRQGIVAPIIIAHAIGKTHVGRGRAALIDPGILVRRNRLRRQLAAEPVGFFTHDDRLAHPQCRQRRADRARPATDNQNIRVLFFHNLPFISHYLECSGFTRLAPQQISLSIDRRGFPHEGGVLPCAVSLLKIIGQPEQLIVGCAFRSQQLI